MGIPDCSNRYSIHGNFVRNAKSKYLIGPDGKPLGIIPDAKREQPKEHKTVQQTAIDKDKKMRNNLLLGALTIALALFFYWCFGNDWVSIGIFTACIVFPVSILLDGSLTKIERDRIFVIYIIAFFVIFFWQPTNKQVLRSLFLLPNKPTVQSSVGKCPPLGYNLSIRSS